ncbi:hypothetical protein [Streptomyces sp. NBC_00878]|uniref:hypothetical protein n=1 Tax=Streptomyces sp. NBC_00878 TaxID=2975854 RepID=UPI0022569264|nr:hypothetical protein [Streptomyces sp. NBC_00878]MCX4909282.1 hypothetical protein [Streptomyces sp. NBC_00878]
MIELSALVDALKAHALDATLTGEGQIVVNLPGTRDQLILGPSRSGSEPRLFWQRRTFLGTRTNECGYLEWTADPGPVVGEVVGYAHSNRRCEPPYGPVLDALRSIGLDPAVVATGGGRHLICAYLADGTRLVIGAPGSLPPQLTQVSDWQVRHTGPGGRSRVVYQSAPQDRDPEAATGEPGIDLMAKHVARYLTEAGLRHDGHRPLPAPEQEVTAGSVARLIKELAQLPSHQGGLDTSGGALITLAERDGANATAVEVPAELASRIHSVLLSMLTVMRPYDE